LYGASARTNKTGCNVVNKVFLAGALVVGTIVVIGALKPDEPKTAATQVTASVEAKAPEPHTGYRDCSQPPYGASQASYQANLITKMDKPETVQKVCIGQNFPDSPQRKTLLMYGFTAKEIEETDTVDLTGEMTERMIKVLNAAAGKR
jgi:hypothetical protein